MPDVASSALSGAGTGAAIGSVIPVIGTGVGAIAGGIIGAGGALLSGAGTSAAQSQANAAAAQNAAAQSAQSFLNYLSSRGTNIQQIIANDPRGPQFWQNQYQQSVAAGDHRDFNTWFVAAINNARGDPIWTTIASPTIGNGAQNTTLPDYVTIGGAPAQPAIANAATNLYQGATGTTPIGQIATLQNAHGLLAAHPEIAAELTAAGVGNDGRSPEQFLVDHITQTEAQSGGGRFTDALKSFVAGDAAAKAGPAGGGPGSGIDTGSLVTQNTAVNKNITDLLSGATLAGNLAGLQPALDARSAAADLQKRLLDEQRAGATGINTAQLAGLQDLLGARATGAAGIYDATTSGARGVSDATLAGLANLLGIRVQGAGDIYNATVSGAGGLRNAQEAAAQGISTADLAGIAGLLSTNETGARDVYGANLLSADTYAQSAQQALARQLAEQQANRARQGFTGTSSGSDLERARLMATAIQAGAGARAGAGVTLEQSLAAARQQSAQQKLQDAVALATGQGAARTGYASNIGTAGINQAGQVAGASEQNALGLLQNGVNLATSLGNAGTTRASTLAGAQEQAATGRLGANTQLATTQAGLLDANPDIAKQQAAFQNAMDSLNLAISGQKDQINASGLPNQNASNTLAVQNQQAQSIYDQLNALMKTLQPLTLNQAGGPGLATSNPGSVLNTQQILGGALTGLGTAVGTNSTANNLAGLLKLLGGSGSAGGAGTTGFGSSGSLLGQSNIFGNTDLSKLNLGTLQLAGGG